VVAAATIALASRAGTALRVATGLVSHTLCSDTFVAGRDPDRTVAETFGSMPILRRLLPAMRYRVDRERGEVRVSLLGLLESRAGYRPGLGCTLIAAGGPPPVGAAPDLEPVVPRLGAIAGPAVVEPADEHLRQALDHAFADPPDGPARDTKAVVVLHHDRVVAERYAPGWDVDTPLLGWSMSKSVVNALVGVLGRQGRLSLAGPAPVPAWRDPGDPRHAITIEQLMRMTSGLALDETNSVNPSSRMLFVEPDMAAFAERAPLIAPPGTRYHYSSPSTLILSRIVRDAVGGRPEDVIRFAHRELFGPLGLRGVTMEFDAAGTPVGSSYVYATARDWARLGLLYTHDGVVGGQRILPEGWVDFSASWTPGSRDGYGAGFFTNRGASEYGLLRVRGGMPPGSFFASGTQGQRIVIAPAEGLVVVRLGRSQDWETFDIRGLIRLVADTNTALNGPP